MRLLPRRKPRDIFGVFIYGINISEKQIVKKALQGFYGIGENAASRICAKFSIHDTAKVGSLNYAKITALQVELSKMTLENELRRKLRESILRLKEMGAYRGRRHAMGLPVRGQNTRSQINTARKLNMLERRG